MPKASHNAHEELQNILKFKRLKNASEVKILLGMPNFYGSKFIPNHATFKDDLCIITRKSSTIVRSNKQDEVLNKFKQLNIAYNNQEAETHIFVDAFPVVFCATFPEPDKDGNHKVQNRSVTDICGTTLFINIHRRTSYPLHS